MSGSPTMKDVARLAGTGLTTVSRVVNESGPVGDETRKRVLDAISELDYQPNEIARALRPGQRSRTIGLKLGDLTNPFWSHLAAGAIKCSRRRGYAALIGTSDESPEVERRSIDDLLSHKVAGLILSPDANDSRQLLELRHDSSVPLVLVDRPSPELNSDTVVFDNMEGGFLAAEHLIKHGHSRIAVLVAPSYYTTGLRLRGYRKALREHGITADSDLVVRLSSGSVTQAEEAMSRLLRLPEPPTAVFTTTNFMTEGALLSMHHSNKEVALVGFDDVHMAELLRRPVTVVAADTSVLGATATSMLIDRIEGDDSQPRRVVIPVRLIPRGSGELSPEFVSSQF
ncbi:LacI family DNA-binding transcriptional regulator [Actinomycetaceae bacterium MB13-C1-2]|nr:LacI family DNA-binding transcriptional regulator [Actinomycetaceae bacterium MB13-C1-2]